MNHRAQIATLLRWAERDRYWLYLSILCSVISGLCTMVPYYGVYQLMAAGFAGALSLTVIGRNAALVAVAMVVRFVFFGSSGVFSHKGAYGALYRVRCRVVDHMAKVPLGALNRRSTGMIKTVLNEDIEKLELFLAHNLPELIYYMIGPVAVFFYLLHIQAPLALLTLLPMLLAFLVMGTLFRRTAGLMGRMHQSLAALNAVMVEYVSGMRQIKAYNMGSRSFAKFSAAIAEENDVWNDAAKRMGPPYAAFVVIIECGMLLMVPLGGWLFMQGRLSAGAFLLFAYVGALYLTEIRPLQELGSQFAEALNGVTKVEEILALPTFEAASGDFPKQHDIVLQDVSFSYDGRAEVLHDCNLTVADGERLGLVGRSGAGKSTVVALIARFHDVTAGEIRIGGKNIRDIDYDTLLQNVAIVFQKTFLTRDSVFENIRMGSDASLEDVRAAAKQAQIDDFIMSLPDGYDTRVGSFGTRFSGGEKQRIAIARAILKDAPILILDEATSAADPEHQLAIDRAIANLCRGKTVIVVAHRLSALKMCDRIAVVEDHTITDIGPHERVRANNAYYRKACADDEAARQMTYQLEGGAQ